MEKFVTLLLQIRGVADRKKLPYFPYRDDGYLVWKQIKSFVKDYVRLYVRSRPIEYLVKFKFNIVLLIVYLITKFILTSRYYFI